MGGTKVKAMNVEHSLTIRCRCPIDHETDAYRVTVRTDRVVKVEDILAAVADLTKQEAFQENLTERLARRLGCEVETIGTHSGVQTRVVA